MRSAPAWFLVLLACAATGRQGGPADAAQGPTFEYARTWPDDPAQRVEMERLALARAAEAREALAWGLGLALLLEIARSADGAVAGALALDAALDELVAARALGLLAALPDDRRAGLGRALSGFDADDPVGMRGLVRGLTKDRLDAVRTRVLDADDPSAALDDLLRAHGWTAPGLVGPLGRQRARDRSAFGSAERGAVAGVTGLDRWHRMLPPTEALAGVPRADLEYRHQRARNYAVRLDGLWTHQDMPRLDDFVLDMALRDQTGITGLVHGDSFALAQHDRMRRWRLREALWRVGW